MTLAEVHLKWSVIVMDLSGPDIFSALWMKGQVFHRERAHLKVSGWSLVCNELLTKQLPTFLSRLNEVSGGFEKKVPVSESFWSNWKFLRMIDLTTWLWGRNVRVNGMRSVFSISAVCNADCPSIYWARYGILDVGWMRRWIQQVPIYLYWTLVHRTLPSIEVLMSRIANYSFEAFWWWVASILRVGRVFDL